MSKKETTKKDAKPKAEKEVKPKAAKAEKAPKVEKAPKADKASTKAKSKEAEAVLKAAAGADAFEDDEDEDYPVVTLTDEEGNDVDFEIVWELEYKGKFYQLLHPVEPDDDIEEDEVLVFELTPVEDDPEMLNFVLLTDDKLADEVFAQYEKEFDELYGPLE
ncbi:MAG: DUF1292 domain-containing protein [Firmicutes bacterium]|nr:DUF1292 domain-containing protein [Bacillota bacterium]